MQIKRLSIRRVRTPAGARRFDLPIGAPIVEGQPSVTDRRADRRRFTDAMSERDVELEVETLRGEIRHRQAAAAAAGKPGQGAPKLFEALTQATADPNPADPYAGSGYGVIEFGGFGKPLAASHRAIQRLIEELFGSDTPRR